MSAIEIVLLVLGAVVLAAGYFLPSKKENQMKVDTSDAKDEIKELVEEQMEGARTKISDIVDETISYAMEKSERSMERVSNEKIMAVNEYSDTVLGEIHKNHEEVMFLYDMLMDKHDNLKNTVAEANKTVTDVKQTLRDAEITAESVKNQIAEASQNVNRDSVYQTSHVYDAVDKMTQEDIIQKEIVTEEHMTEEHTEENASDKLVVKNTVENDVTNVDIPHIQKDVKDQNNVAELHEKMEPVEFKPINPPVVEIIGGPDVEGNPEAELAMLLQKSKSTTKKKGVKTEKNSGAKKRATRTISEELEAPNLDIEFNKGNNGPRNNNEKILELHQLGKSNMAIAKELGLGIGEVKLVIDLYEGMKG